MGIDGVSIGSNDLTQLMLGVDRDSEVCAELFDESDGAVLDAIARIIAASQDAGITSSLCGQARPTARSSPSSWCGRASRRSPSTPTPPPPPAGPSPTPSAGCSSTPPAGPDMGDDLRLGRVAGVRVGASWSVLVIAALLTWTLATGVFPDVDPAGPPAGHWVVAAVTAVAFLALPAGPRAGPLDRGARAAGIEVEGITLWMFGGVSRLKGESPDARTEQRVALAGPWPASSSAWR